MAIDKGWRGAVKVGASTVAQINEWTLDMSMDALEFTNFGSTYDREFMPGLRSFSGSFSGYSEDTDACQHALLAEFTTDTDAPAVVTLSLLTSAANGFTGSAVLTGITRGAVADGLQTFSATFQLAGSLSTV